MIGNPKSEFTKDQAISILKSGIGFVFFVHTENMKSFKTIFYRERKKLFPLQQYRIIKVKGKENVYEVKRIS